MHWNEKINLIKKRYSEDEFSVPHINRKEILRKIETKFISKSADYYELNNNNERFSNWWDNIKITDQNSLETQMDLEVSLDKLIGQNDTFWLAAEFADGIMIYKAKKDAALHLISIGRTWTNTFHLIQLKYEFLISFGIGDSKIEIKRSLNKEIEKK